MHPTFWTEYFILFIAAIIGSIAILPYSLRLIKESAEKKPLKFPFHILILLSILQNVVLFAIVIAVGLVTAHSIGLHNQLGVTQMGIFSGLILGIISGSALLILDLVFMPHLPKKLLSTALKTTQFENVSAAFYGGINEELIMRLFGLSIIAWSLTRIWHTNLGLPTTGVFWTANCIMAVIFSLGHLPAVKKLVGEITQILLLRTLVLNIVVALICGWLFWNYGIISAMIAHFAADIVYHVSGTYVLRMKFTNKH